MENKKFKTFILSMTALFVVSVTLLYLFQKNGGELLKKIDNVNGEPNQSSVEDCLNRYDFDGARKIWAKEPDKDKLFTIVKSESAFYFREGEIEKAFQVIDESDLGYKEGEGERLKYKLYEDVVEVFLDKNDLDGAKKYAQKSPEDIWSEGGEYGVTTDPSHSIRHKLLKRIKEFKKN